MTTPSPTSETTTGRRSRRWYQRPSGIAAAIVVAGSFGLWTYAFSGAARRDPPDTLSDPAFATAAEPICAETRTVIDGLEPAAAATDPIDRANTLRQANEALAGLVTRLRTIEPTNDFDRDIVTKWLTDWDQYLVDRNAYADTLSTGEDALFRLTTRNGQDYTKSMDNFATVNDMGSCATPGDV